MFPLLRNHRKLLSIAFALSLMIAPLSAASAQRKQQPERREIPTVGDPISAALSLGSSIINSAAGLVQSDPYSQFRGERYSNAGLLSERDEIALGNQLDIEIRKKSQVVAEGQERVNRVGNRVARASLRPNLAYRFHIIRSREINAYSAPGGHIYITTGLLDLANDDELASVLSHEVGHVVARHSLKTLQQSQFLGGIADLIGSVTGVAGDTAGQLGKAAASIVASGLLASHNREEEREADYLGVNGMAKAGFSPQAMITMFQKLQRMSRTNPGLMGSLFSDHPDVQERIDNTTYEINRMRGRG
ncbi:MAG TPA: M48 family metallopeptidase [Pyrinomonadaceae bacterium]|nr:M48 family metallopeptidase [Pyrinomonadaceae bacterium]